MVWFTKRMFLSECKVALPTVYLFLTAIGVTVASIGLGELGSLNPGPISLFSSVVSLLSSVVSLFGLTVSSYAMFTVTHDAIHGSISSDKLINDGLGTVSNLWLGPVSNWYGLRATHLQHHLHTNDPTLDPDFWVSERGFGGVRWKYLRWASLDFHHLYSYLTLRDQSRTAFCLYEVGKLFLVSLFLTFFPFQRLLFYWLIPSRLCIFILAFLFDYLPHAPHESTKREDKYRTTAYLSVPAYLAPIAKYLLFYQNYHLIHHLFPRYPFYQMYHLWLQRKEDLLGEKSVRVTRILTFLGTEDLASDPPTEDLIGNVDLNIYQKILRAKEFRDYLGKMPTEWISYFYHLQDVFSGTG